MPFIRPTPDSDWQARLLTASFRGIPFGILDTRGSGGRRVRTHEYPFRDEPYSEDLGRRARRFQFSGFLVGDDAPEQLEPLLRAAEQKHSGMLVHPTRGYMQMQLEPVEYEERWDKGRYIEVRLSFVEPGRALYPASSTDTQAQTKATVDVGEVAVSDAYTKAIEDANAAAIATGAI